MKTLGKIKLHSVVELITNSSTEIFCTVQAESKKVLKTILDGILAEMGCTAVEFRILEATDDDENPIPGEFWIEYDYECFQAPCKYMLKLIKEKLNVVSE